MDLSDQIDDIGWRILDALQRDGRLNFAALGRAVGLSAPAIAERVRRLEAMGIITGYQARVDRARLGYGLTAFVRLRAAGDVLPRLAALIRDTPEILDCHHVTGEHEVILKLAARSIAHLDALILRLAPYGATTSSVVLSTMAEGRPVPAPRPPARDRAGQPVTPRGRHRPGSR